MKRFTYYFENKYAVANIAEKALKNIKKKKDNIYYFAIGHIFKQLDKQLIFNISVDKNGQAKINRFKGLSYEIFSDEFKKRLKKYISDIRNIFSHYIHTFSEIKIDDFDNSNFVLFLKDAFKLAVINSYCNENQKDIYDFLTNIDEKKLVEFLSEKFYPIKKGEYEAEKEQKYITFIEYFKQKSFDEAVTHLLFIKINNKKTLKWDKINFDIEEGYYLSFEGSLFLLSMFLYKNEANSLISKIRGFKRNDNNKYKSKRNIFTIYAKKFTSQDVDNENKNLVKFRDIINYLNHYPAIWDLTDKTYREDLDEKIIDIELKKTFPNLNNDLWELAKLYFFDETKYKENFDKLSAEKKEHLIFCLERTNRYKDTYYKAENTKNNKKIKEILKQEENKTNQETTKIKEKIKNGRFFTSYSRYKNKFLEYGMRFLAEQNFFGYEAKFKVYKYFYPEDEKKELDNLKSKDYDNLKFHNGKQTCFRTYSESLKANPQMDIPFVIANNSVLMKLQISDNEKDTLISINKDILLFLLEYALFYDNQTNIENKGKELLKEYFKTYQENLNDTIDKLKNKNTQNISKKIIPRRFLKKKLNPNYSRTKSLEIILENAEKKEKQYNDYLRKIEEEANKLQTDEKNKFIENFKKKHKGKKYKFDFIRKAWNLMYFSEIYKHNIEIHGKHKQYHITKEEFNSFSKWMYAFDEVKVYKQNLIKLFETKGFFNNKEFKNLFQNSNSLDDLYIETKKNFENWIKKEQPKKKKNYADFNLKILLINKSHFIEFLKAKNLLEINNDKIRSKASINFNFLISDFYGKNDFGKNYDKKFRKFYKKIRKIKLEDALLFEIAKKYANADNYIFPETITVDNIQKENIVKEVDDIKFVVPFKKINEFEELNNLYGNSEKSFLSNLLKYARISCIIKEQNRNLTLEIYFKTITTLINDANKFIKVYFAIEKFLIAKHNIQLKGKNRIEFKNITNIENFIEKNIRDKAFHLGFPECKFVDYTEKIRQKFNKTDKGNLDEKFFNKIKKIINEDKQVYYKKNNKNQRRKNYENK